MRLHDCILLGVKVGKLQRSATRQLKASNSKDYIKIFYFSIHPKVLEATWCVSSKCSEIIRQLYLRYLDPLFHE